MSPTKKKKIRESIRIYCKQAVSNEPHIHYSQARPFPLIDLIGVGWHTLVYHRGLFGRRYYHYKKMTVCMFCGVAL